MTGEQYHHSEKPDSMPDGQNDPGCISFNPGRIILGKRYHGEPITTGDPILKDEPGETQAMEPIFAVGCDSLYLSMELKGLWSPDGLRYVCVPTTAICGPDCPGYRRPISEESNANPSKVG